MTRTNKKIKKGREAKALFNNTDNCLKLTFQTYFVLTFDKTLLYYLT